jgi:uncharacterized protein
MPNFSILLPPSDGKQAGGNPFAPDMFDYRTSNTFNYFNELNPERRRLIETLHDVIERGEGLEEIFVSSTESLEQIEQANLEIYDAPLMSALDRYSPGVLYRAMDFAGLPTGAQRRLLENGVIFSGLFGLLRPDDLIPEYYLPMDAALPGVGKLSEYWRPLVSPVVNRTLAGTFVWNFLSPLYEKCWDDEHTYDAMVRVRFFIERNGTQTELTSDVEPLMGKLVNFIVRDSVESIEPLKEWTHPDGFVFDAGDTSENAKTRAVTIAFVKKA